MQACKILIVGHPELFHVGAHFLQAAIQSKVEASLADVNEANQGLYFWKKIYWHLLGHRPCKLNAFSTAIRIKSIQEGYTHVLATGLAPIRRSDLIQLNKIGIATINFLTDDPFNPAHRAPWFLEALPHYQHVFSPRKSNLEDLRKHGCQSLHYLPFAYDPASHKRINCNNLQDQPDVFFAGGADADRVPFFLALANEGFNLALFGNYWGRHKILKKYWRGNASIELVCQMAVRSKVCICLVRRANRDGHSMRSFEIPAMGGCVLAESTKEHFEIFGQEGVSALYFKDVKELLFKTKMLVENPLQREILSRNSFNRIVSGANTYSDRLNEIIDVASKFNSFGWVCFE